MRRLWIILAIPLILGCIGAGDDEIDFEGCVPDITNGLVISNLESDLQTIFSDDEVTLTVELENLGSSEATGIEAELLNFAGLELVAGESLILRIPDMAVPEEDMPLVADDAAWVLSPEGFGGAGTKDLELVSSISYGYTSKGNAMVRFIPESEWRKMRQEGEEVQIDRTCTNGPLAVSVEPLRFPVTEKTGEFTTRIVIKNIGGGKVNTRGIDALGTITLTLPAGLTKGSVCDFSGTGKELTTSGRSLNRNGELIMTCKLMLDSEVQTIREELHEVAVEVDYTYVVDTATSVTVSQEASVIAIEPLGVTTSQFDYDVINVSEDKDDTIPLGYENITLTINPRYNGRSITDANMTKYAVTIKNDMINSEALKTLNVTWDPLAKEVNVTVTVPKPKSTKIYVKNTTITLQLDYSRKKASAIFENIQVIK